MASDLKRHTKELVEKETRIRELEITIDHEKTKKAVSKITETEYFKKLRTEAADIRAKRRKA
jgi:DnaJ-domain-containing protein 1